MKAIILGALALIGGVMLLALSIATGTNGVHAGNGSPTPTPDPTVDPCQFFKPPVPPTCVPTQPPRRESTNTPEVTATNTPGPTDVPGTAAPTFPPPPTNTPVPGGGAGAGGVSPPDTGTGPGGSELKLSWLLALGAAMAIAGGATIVFGVRRDR